MQAVELNSTVTCPECGHRERELMPPDTWIVFYHCKACNALLKPLEGDCCVFCSYGSLHCPSKQ